MLRAIPVRIFSKTFSLQDGDSELARISIGWLRDRGTATIDGREMRLNPESALRGAFELELDGAIIARAYKPSVFRNRFEVELENVRIELERESVLSRSFVVRRGETVLGRISRESILTRRARIDLPDEWPTAVQVFVFWLVLIIWKRMDNA